MPTDTKWTRGPWQVSFGKLVRIKDSRSLTTIAGVHRQGRYTGELDNGQVAANAHLISAAPELFAALDVLLANSGYTHMDDAGLRCEAELGNGIAPILLRCRATLAKAAGRSTP